MLIRTLVVQVLCTVCVCVCVCSPCRYNTVDVSVAVSTDGGLITPIVFDADEKVRGKGSEGRVGGVEGGLKEWREGWRSGEGLEEL